MKKLTAVVIIINVFLLLVVNVMSDYFNLDKRMASLDNTISSSVNSSISTVLLSEDFFTPSAGGDSSNSGKPAQMSVWNGAGFTVGNLYAIGFYISDNGSIPNQAEYNNFVSSKGGITGLQAYIYDRLYGNSANRIPSTSFRDFYNTVGDKITTSSLAYDNVTGNFTTLNYPLLAKTGLKLHTVNSSGRYSVGGSSMFDSVKGEGGTNGYYFFTPVSLGITYFDEELLEGIIYCALDTAIRCNKVSNYSGTSLESASGSLPTSVFDGGTNLVKSGDGHTVVNDGDVEYFLDTLDVDVNYYVIDVWNNANWQIVNYLIGSSVGQSPLTLPQRLRASSTKYSVSLGAKPASDYVVVAEITVEMRVSVPYRSSVLQWNRYRKVGNNDDFYGVLEMDSAGNLSSDDDGLVYKYTTYTAVMN